VKDRNSEPERGSEWEPIIFIFSEELGVYPNRNSESHTNKRKHTQTSLETLGTKLEKARKQSGSKHERT
jgi:hypothetical protein